MELRKWSWLVAALAGCVDGDVNRLTNGEALGDATIRVTMTWINNAEPSDAPEVALAAYQDGDGAWQEMPFVDGAYVAHVTGERYAMAFGCRTSDQGERRSLELYYATVAEGTEIKRSTCYWQPTPHRVTIAPHNVPADAAIVSVGFGRSWQQLGLEPTLLPSATTTGDLVAAITTFSYDHGFAEWAPLKVARIDDLDIHQTPVVDLDFGLPLATPLSFPVTLNGDTLHGRIRSNVSSPTAYNLLASTQGTMYALPPALVREDDRPTVSFTVTDAAISATRGGSYAYEPSSVGPMDLDVGALYAMPPPSVVTYPSPRPSLTFTPSPATLPVTSYDLSLREGPLQYYAAFSQAWIDALGEPVVRWTMPSFEGLQGWAPDFWFSQRTPIAWSAARDESNTDELRRGRITRYSSTSGNTGEYCGNGIVEPYYETCDPPNTATCDAQCFTIYPSVAPREGEADQGGAE